MRAACCGAVLAKRPVARLAHSLQVLRGCGLQSVESGRAAVGVCVGGGELVISKAVLANAGQAASCCISRQPSSACNWAMLHGAGRPAEPRPVAQLPFSFQRMCRQIVSPAMAQLGRRGARRVLELL